LKHQHFHKHLDGLEINIIYRHGYLKVQEIGIIRLAQINPEIESFDDEQGREHIKSRIIDSVVSRLS